MGGGGRDVPMHACVQEPKQMYVCSSCMYVSAHVCVCVCVCVCVAHACGGGCSVCV